MLNTLNGWAFYRILPLSPLETIKKFPMQNEKSSKLLATIAGRVLRNPETASHYEIVALAACVLTQTADKPIYEVAKRTTNKPKRKHSMAKKGSKKGSSMKGGKKSGSKSC